MSKTESFADISQAIEHLAAIPTTAKTLADANAIRDIAESVGKRLRHLSTAIEPYRNELNKSRRSSPVLHIGTQRARNAHDLTLAYVQSWYFGLWSAVDFAAWMKSLNDSSIRFDPGTIEDEPDKAIGYCREWPDDDWDDLIEEIGKDRDYKRGEESLEKPKDRDGVYSVTELADKHSVNRGKLASRLKRLRLKTLVDANPPWVEVERQTSNQPAFLWRETEDVMNHIKALRPKSLRS